MLKLFPALALLTLALLLPDPAHADGRPGRHGGRRNAIVIGPHETVDCAKYDNYTEVLCNPYRRRREHDDPYSPAHALLRRLQPWQSGECLKDRAGGIIFQCHVPEGWVDPNPPQPEPMPEPEPQPLPPSAEEQYLIQTHNEVASLLGLISNVVGGEKGPRIDARSLQQIHATTEYFRSMLAQLVFVAPASCREQCDLQQRASESAGQIAEAFRGTSWSQFSADQLAELKGRAQVAYQLTNNAGPAPALTASDVCGKLMWGEAPGANLFRSTGFGVRTVITSANQFGARIRAEFMTTGAKPLGQAEGTCTRQGPERKDLWVITAPYQGTELRIELRQVNPESKALAISATMGGQPIKIRH